MRRYLIPATAFLLGSSLIAAAYLGLLSWAQGWDYAYGQFWTYRAYVIPIWLAFGLQSALYSVLRFRLLIPSSSAAPGGAMLGTSGGTSLTTMVACCLHHATDVLPILGLSAATTFLTRYQRPFMLLSLAINLVAILLVLAILYREWRRNQPDEKPATVLELQ